jgi:ankyrin repeat protein
MLLQAQDNNGEDRFHSPKFTVNPPLSGAAIADRLECVQVLVDEVGVWIDEPDACGGSTALLYAMAYGHVEVVKFLLSRGASIVTREGHTDLVALALERGNADVARVVIESEQWKASGAEVNLDHLRYAAQGGNVELAQLVISSCSVPLPTGNLEDLTEPQRDAILGAISFAIQAGALACLQQQLPLRGRHTEITNKYGLVIFNGKSSIATQKPDLPRPLPWCVM